MPNLVHAGVKGMKWGVRKEHHRSYSEKASKDSGSSLGRIKSTVNMSRYFSKGAVLKKQRKIDEVWYDNLSTGKEFVEKGATLKRIVREVGPSALEGRLYVAQLKSDADMYQATIPAFQKSMAFGRKNYHSVYQVSMETKKKLTMPSQKTRVDTWIETVKTKEGKKWLSENGYKDQVDELNAKQIGLKSYEKFNKYAGDQSAKINDVYFNKIRSKGYNALIDDNDAGIWSKKPTILLDSKGTVKIKSVKQLSADDINEAQRKVLKYRAYSN